MKKIFSTVALFSTFVLGTFAADGDGYRRTWDFTKGWSEETIEKLTNDPTTWEVQEATGFQNNPAGMTANAAPWVTVNGEKEPIAELVGISINSNLAKAKHCQIVTKFHGVPDTPCFWMNGKGDAVTVTVPAGENVKFGYAPHGNNDRGYSCSAGFADANGATTFTATDKDGSIIREVELINSNAEESKLTLTTVNGGSHIYYIIIGEGDKEEEVVETTPRVAYLVAGEADLDADLVFSNSLASFDSKAFNLDTCTYSPLADTLLNYDVVVFSNFIAQDNALAKQLFWIVNKVPVLNLNATLLTAWNIGSAVYPEPKSATITVKEDYREDEIFQTLTMEDGVISMFEADENVEGNLMLGYTLAEDGVFAGDEAIATVGEVNAVHTHGTKNLYMLLPLAAENMTLLSGDAQILVNAAVAELAKTKAKVSKAATPSVNFDYQNLSTTVSLSCRTAGSVIYYTLDGTEPTPQSPIYSEPFVITANETPLRAIAVAHGYFTSDEANTTIAVKKKLAKPIISIEEREGETIIYLSTTEDANIYYSFLPVTDKTKATLYEEPITVYDASTIYAFAEWATAVQSETASKSFGCGGIPAIKDTVALFSPDVVSWGDSTLIYHAGELVGDFADAVTAGIAALKNGAYYHIGSSARPYYSEEVDYVETVKDGEGNVIKSLMNPEQDSTITHYKKDPAAHYEIFSKKNPGWVIKTDGQVVTTEKSAPAYYVGNGAQDRCPESAIDLITGGPQCKGLVDFNGKYSGAPYCMSVETIEKVAAPFYVEAYFGNGSDKNTSNAIEIQVSADGTEWKSLQMLNFSTNQRYWKRTKVHFDEAGEWYVRIAQVGNFSKGQLYDVLVMTTDGVTGIETIAANGASAKNQFVVDLFGRRVNGEASGQFIVKDGRKVLVK